MLFFLVLHQNETLCFFSNEFNLKRLPPKMPPGNSRCLVLSCGSNSLNKLRLWHAADASPIMHNLARLEGMGYHGRCSVAKEPGEGSMTNLNSNCHVPQWNRRQISNWPSQNNSILPVTAFVSRMLLKIKSSPYVVILITIFMNHLTQINRHNLSFLQLHCLEFGYQMSMHFFMIPVQTYLLAWFAEFIGHSSNMLHT